MKEGPPHAERTSLRLCRRMCDIRRRCTAAARAACHKGADWSSQSSGRSIFCAACGRAARERSRGSSTAPSAPSQTPRLAPLMLASWPGEKAVLSAKVAAAAIAANPDGGTGNAARSPCDTPAATSSIPNESCTSGPKHALLPPPPVKVTGGSSLAKLFPTPESPQPEFFASLSDRLRRLVSNAFVRRAFVITRARHANSHSSTPA